MIRGSKDSLTFRAMEITLETMNVVLLHDWLTGMRGGERVLEAFCELFPDAPLYTLIHKPGSTSKLIENRKITTSFLNRVPGIFENYRKFLPLFPIAADSLRIVEKADLILSSSHCVIKAVKKPFGARHVSYIHSPMRYIYDQFDAYFGPQAPLSQRLAAPLIRGYLTKYDLASNQNVDQFIANSQFVRGRINKYYSRDALVIHPFVEISDFLEVQKNPPPKEDFFLMVTAFAPNKRVDVAVDAFNKWGRRLVVVGSGQQDHVLRARAGKNIEFKGNLPRSEIVELFARAQAFIFPGVEDFGITPLESMASGTPVIALHAGGVLETLTSDTADFFDMPTKLIDSPGSDSDKVSLDTESNALLEALRRFDPRRFDRSKLIARASEFSKEKFKEKISCSLIKSKST